MVYQGIVDSTLNKHVTVFRRVRKIAKSDYLLRHVCLSVRIEHLGCQWTDFHEIWYVRGTGIA